MRSKSNRRAGNNWQHVRRPERAARGHIIALPNHYKERK
jgi:hypothetical protein